MDSSRNQPLLSLLSDSLQRKLVAAGQTRRFDDGQTIHTRGSGRPGLSVIMSGRVRFGTFSEDGDFIHTGLLSEGHCFGEVTLFANMPRAYHADAVGETVMLAVCKKQFDKLFDDDPGFARAFLGALTNRLYEALDFADDLRRLTLEAKIAKQLFRVSRVGGFSADSIIPIRQIDLAYALGMSRVSIGKALEALQGRGVIELGYGEIKIIDAAGLKALIANKSVGSEH